MKSILYIGAFLMIGAGIYGFVDYKQTSKKTEFSKMYDSNDEPTPTNEKAKIIVVPEKLNVENKMPVKKNKISKTKSLRNDPFLNDNSTESQPISDTLLKNILSNDNERKVLSYKLFSRAPLEKKYISKELKLEPAKTEDKQQ